MPDESPVEPAPTIRAGQWALNGSTGSLNSTGGYWINPVTYSYSSTTVSVSTWATTTSSTAPIGNRPVRMQPGSIARMNVPTQQLTPEEEADHTRRQAEYQERIAQRRRERESAEERARELLFRFLNDAQRAQYEDDGTFDFVGNLGTHYRIGPGTNGNVTWYSDNQRRGQLCAHPRMRDPDGNLIPEPDLHLGQLFALTVDEAKWLGHANLHAGNWPPTHQPEVHATQLAA